MTNEPALEDAICTLDDVLITGQVAPRTARARDVEEEAEALGVLAGGLAYEPRALLQRLVETAMALCRADSAGVSVLGCDGEGEKIRWQAVTGELAMHVGRETAREASPCGVAISRDQPLLFDRAERHFAAIRGLSPSSHEQLVTPWRIDGEPAGTLWVVAHSADRHFDREDLRLLTILAGFASAAWRIVLALDAASVVRAESSQDETGRVVARFGAATGMHTQRRSMADVQRRVTDRTAELARANAALTQSATDRITLARQLVLAEEEERRRLSRELHDEVGQHLTALGLGLRGLSDVAPPGSDVDRRATQLQSLADTLGRELHAIAVRLRPRALDDFGLEAALQSYGEEWSRQSGIPLHLHTRGGSERLPPEIESTIYRIVQEALTNVARHSGATRAGVVLERRSGHIRVVVDDDGHGFEPTSVPTVSERGPGLGLLGIRERTAIVGGTMDVETTPGAGTTLFIRLPIEHGQSVVTDADARGGREGKRGPTDD